MNYQRIYDAFIADRRTLEDFLPLLENYTEKHHIVPRSLGGGDEPANIIRLTPEDPFFVHLLLAKIHGGELWAPIAFMVGGSRKDYKPSHSRKRHGWAVRAMANARRGEGAYQFDHTLHEVVDADGRVLRLRQADMPEALGVSRSLANMLIKGRISVAKGWSVVGRKRKTAAGSAHPMHRSEVREFRHVNGDVFVGTQLEFSEQKKLRRPDVSRLVPGVYGATQGWYLAERGLPKSAHAKAKWQKHIRN
jgi:hypothetical protein